MHCCGAGRAPNLKRPVLNPLAQLSWVNSHCQTRCAVCFSNCLQFQVHLLVISAYLCSSGHSSLLVSYEGHIPIPVSSQLVKAKFA